MADVSGDRMGTGDDSEDVDDDGQTGGAEMNHNDKVVRIQGDRLCQFLGYPEGTKIDVAVIRAIANAGAGDLVKVDGKGIVVGMSAIGIAQVLLKKIE